MQMPNAAIAAWLEKFLESVLTREKFKKCKAQFSKLTNEAILCKLNDFSLQIDHLVFDISFMDSTEEMKKTIASVPQDIHDCFVLRTLLVIADLETSDGMLEFADQPDIRAALRIFLIEDEKVRNGPWPTH